MKIFPFVLCSFLMAAMTLNAAEEGRAERVPIQVVSFEPDSGRKPERVFVIRATAYRDFAALKKAIPGYSRYKPTVHFVVYGMCDTSVPGFSPEDIDELAGVCAKAGVQFTYFPAG